MQILEYISLFSGLDAEAIGYSTPHCWGHELGFLFGGQDGRLSAIFPKACLCSGFFVMDLFLFVLVLLNF